jgi:LytS/YehU family sensor histidine kinase
MNTNLTWNPLENDNLEFTSLPFGTLKLQLRAVDRWGKSSASPVFLTIINKPPFWKTGWFLATTYLLTAILIGIFVFLYLRYRHKKKERLLIQKRKFLELETMAFRSQINPHFIFNSLSSIQHHILKSDPVSANAYLHKLSTLIRKTLQSSSNSTILLSEEISIIKVYLELQKLRLEEKLQYSINMSDRLFEKDLRIPSMIIQPFVENAIKHGISPDENQQGKIVINISRVSNVIVCEIEDNGVGIHTTQRMNQKNAHISMGSNITERRIQAINSMQEDKVLLEIRDKKDLDAAQQGTIVKITFIIKSMVI